MRKMPVILFTVLLLSLFSWAKVGDILKVVESPGPCPTGLTFDGQHLWLADTYTDKIYEIDPETGDVLKSFDSPAHHPEGLAWDGQYLWHIDSGEQSIYCLDPQTGRTLRVLKSNSSHPRDLAWDGQYIWLVDNKQDCLLKVSPEEGMMVQYFPSPATEPAGLTFDGKYLWLTDSSEDRIYLVNPPDGLCLSSLRAYGPYPCGLAWGKDALWNVDSENNEIYQIKIFCEDILSQWDERQLSLHFVKEFRNFGPGTVSSLDIYLPMPATRDNQVLLGTVQLDPEPAEVIMDKWGQKIAHFHFKDLKSSAVVQPGWKVKAKIFTTEYFIYPDKIGSLDDIPENIKRIYTQDGDKYQITNPFIQNLARRIAGGEKNPYWIARRIYDYLGRALSTDLNPRGKWNPAPTVLRRGTASFSEYSYAMIALCRALGVPVRYVGAVRLSGDDIRTDDVFHRWTEVYLPPYGWIPFDSSNGEVDLPGRNVLGIGHVAARYILTTENGGGETYLWFGNNYGFQWTSNGKCRIHEESYGMWSPLGEKRYNTPIKKE